MNRQSQEEVKGRVFDVDYLNAISDGHRGVIGRFVQPIIFGQSICGIIIDAEETRSVNPVHSGPHRNYIIVDFSHTRGIPLGELNLQYQDEVVVLPDATPRAEISLSSKETPSFEDAILRARAIFHPASGLGYVPGRVSGN
ncbi:MAG: hypothetical protein V1740_04295 [Candidatus Woesearchaeota archaeon]